MDVQSPTLYPLKAGEILDRGFRLYRANFWFFLKLTSTLLVPILLLDLLSLLLFVVGDMSSPSSLASLFISLLNLVEAFLTVYLLHGAITWATSQIYLGRPVTIRDSYRQAQRGFKSFFGANIRQGLAYVPFVLFFVFVSAGFQTVGLICGFAVAIPVIAFLATRWGLVLPIIMIENLKAGPALGRSWLLTENYFRHTFAIVFASGVLTYLIVSLPSVLIGYGLDLLSMPDTFDTILSAVATQLGQIISLPVSMGIPVILYYDMRVRREGFDLELALQVSEEKDTAPKDESAK